MTQSKTNTVNDICQTLKIGDTVELISMIGSSSSPYSMRFTGYSYRTDVIVDEYSSDIYFDPNHNPRNYDNSRFQGLMFMLGQREVIVEFGSFQAWIVTSVNGV